MPFVLAGDTAYNVDIIRDATFTRRKAGKSAKVVVHFKNDEDWSQLIEINEEHDWKAYNHALKVFGFNEAE